MEPSRAGFLLMVEQPLQEMWSDVMWSKTVLQLCREDKWSQVEQASYSWQNNHSKKCGVM